MQLSTRIFPSRLLPLLIAAVITSATACKTGEEPPVPQERMVSVLTDIHLAEAYGSVVSTDSLSRNMTGKNKDTLAAYYKIILKRNGISYDELIRSMNWYQQRPGMLDTIYSRIQQRLDSLKNIP
jgi:hypothetical protein